jgi:hypothetical protein
MSQKGKPVAIRIDDCDGTIISGNTIEGFETAISATGSRRSRIFANTVKGPTARRNWRGRLVGLAGTIIAGVVTGAILWKFGLS